MSHAIEQLSDALRKLCGEFPCDDDSKYSPTIQRAAALARYLQRRANELQTPAERRQQAELDRMIQNPHDKVTLTQMTDQAFRANTPHRAVDQLVHILDVQGIPRFFTPFDRVLLKGFQSFGSYLPGVAVPLVKEKMQQETANVILPAEQSLLVEHLQARREEGVRMNVNYLGEALLGEEEAQNRLRTYLQALQLPEIEVISVKISTIYSQISSLARQHAVDVLSDRMELLYRAAAKATFTREDGTVVPKFVYLDMEEYRDMAITADAFMQTLDRPGLNRVAAGIVLQAYIPDSYQTQLRLLEWARRRVAQGGTPITLRIVKGANMEMERFEASLQNWPQAPYQHKAETDANYRRMLILGLQPENIVACRLGIASHNLFELAFGLVQALEHDALDKVQFEMLEGMANHQRRALFELSKNLLLYAPACKKEDFIHAIGYLVRRLDENTGADNFLRHAFRLDVDSDEWRQLESQYFQAFDLIDRVSSQPRRWQDRNQPPTQPPAADWKEFRNEPDTDFALDQNQRWADAILESWHDRHGDSAEDIPLVVAGEAHYANRSVRECIDPSRPGHVVGRYRQGTESDVQTAIASAVADDDGWRSTSPSERRALLRSVAQVVRERRSDLMGAALAEGGKTLLESDPEVSEAIDFLEFYGATAEYFAEMRGVTVTPRGVVAVVSPWNFPIAIPCGGVAAALAAGNSVILKPASHTVLVAWQLCQCFWDAGISRRTLQFLPCAGAREGQQLVSDPSVDTVILTGGTETALAMLRKRPDMRLLAETGGKNATIVTSLSDRDQAIKNVIHSAFGHAGQKCSATSLLILESEVYDDAKFKQSLCDAVSSLTVGSAWELPTKMGPMIRPPTGELEKGLKELEPGESWAVMPRRHPRNPHVYTPGVKWGVQPGSFTHMTEFFGPLLGVMRAANLHEAIDLVNATGYGLTSGLESLDDREQEIWKHAIRAGNLYVNRGTTGAIVLRQPFGGMGKSAFGPGIKAGGPNYVAQLMNFRMTGEPGIASDLSDPLLVDFVDRLADCPTLKHENRQFIRAAIGSFEHAHAIEFSLEHDHFRLVGQDNFRRYRPISELRVRVHPDDSPQDIVLRICAGRTVGCRVTVSVPTGWDEQCLAAQTVRWIDDATDAWAASIEFVTESDDDLARAIRGRRTGRMRYADPVRVSQSIRIAAAEANIYIADGPVIGQGRIELLWYLAEQSISDNYHRYGNLGSRADEPRASVQ